MSGGYLGSLVIGSDKAEIVFVGDQDYLRKLFPDHVHAAIRRCIVHHDHLGLDSRPVFIYRLQAVPEQLLGIPTHNQDRQLHGATPALLA